MKKSGNHLFSNIRINLRLFFQLSMLAVSGMAGLFFWQSSSHMQSSDNAAPESCIVLFNAAAYSANENGGLVTIVVARRNDIEPVTVNYATSNGTATAGQDYMATAGTLSFAEKEMGQTFSIQITDDAADEGNETINLTLTNPTGGASLGSPSTVVLTILDNDQSAVNHTDYDFDGDNKADVSVFRPDNGAWYLLNSTSGFSAAQFGISTDKLVPADYDGDGKTDVAVFRDGSWYLLRSSAGFTGVAFGQAGDIPHPADFDGDGKADISVFRPSTGGWYRLNSSDGQFVAAAFGTAEDKPTIGDFDGDGKADIAVFRPSTANWFRLNSSNNQFIAVQFGVAEDKLVPADYDGDSKTDIAVYRPSTGGWYRLNSSNGEFVAIGFGIAEDKPVAADYDGDGKADIAVFRPSDANWYLLKSTQGFGAVQFGQSSDKPVPNAYVP